MQWSKSFLPKEVADSTVMEFTPQKIDMGTPQPALEYLSRKPGSDFRMNDQVQIHTGLDRIEQVSDGERIEKRALEMLAEIQQSAYKEAYDLGLDEGRKRAFEENAVAISEKIGQLTVLLDSMSNLKSDLLSHNEAHLVNLLYHMAGKIVMGHVERNEDAVVTVLRNAVSLAQAEENIRVELNPSQIEFIEQLRQQTGREFEFLRKLSLEPNPSLQPGGCVIETNYGAVDSGIQTRLEKLWETLIENMPKVKDKLAG